MGNSLLDLINKARKEEKSLPLHPPQLLRAQTEEAPPPAPPLPPTVANRFEIEEETPRLYPILPVDYGATEVVIYPPWRATFDTEDHAEIAEQISPLAAGDDSKEGEESLATNHNRSVGESKDDNKDAKDFSPFLSPITAVGDDRKEAEIYSPVNPNFTVGDKSAPEENISAEIGSGLYQDSAPEGYKLLITGRIGATGSSDSACLPPENFEEKERPYNQDGGECKSNDESQGYIVIEPPKFSVRSQDSKSQNNLGIEPSKSADKSPDSGKVYQDPKSEEEKSPPSEEEFYSFSEEEKPQANSIEKARSKSDKKFEKGESSGKQKKHGRSFRLFLKMRKKMSLNSIVSLISCNPASTEKPVEKLPDLDFIAENLNYNQVSVRDFVPSGLNCLIKDNPEPEIVKIFLLNSLHLHDALNDSDKERITAIDAGFWWIILLMSYTKSTGDNTVAELLEVQREMKLILNICLSDDTSPILLCADEYSLTDKRMGYSIEIQALFYFALRCAKQMLKLDPDENDLMERIDTRITTLYDFIQANFWLDYAQAQLDRIYQYNAEYFDTDANKFIVNQESVPNWVSEFMPQEKGGYFIGNVTTDRKDFRWFLLGNCIAILSSLATTEQATAIMDLIEQRWEALIGEMPLKLVYPELDEDEWNIVNRFDPKNTKWSHQNDGSWPVLLWLLTAACMKTGRAEIAERAISLVEKRVSNSKDGKAGRFVGKEAMKKQTWSVSGYLVAKLMMQKPSNVSIISFEAT